MKRKKIPSIQKRNGTKFTYIECGVPEYIILPGDTSYHDLDCRPVKDFRILLHAECKLFSAMIQCKQETGRRLK